MNKCLNITSWGLVGALSGSFGYILMDELIKIKNHKIITQSNQNIINPGFLIGLLSGSLYGYLKRH